MRLERRHGALPAGGVLAAGFGASALPAGAGPPTVTVMLRQSFSQLEPVPPRLDNFTNPVPPCFRALGKFFHTTNSLG